MHSNFKVGNRPSQELVHLCSKHSYVSRHRELCEQDVTFLLTDAARCKRMQSTSTEALTFHSTDITYIAIPIYHHCVSVSIGYGSDPSHPGKELLCIFDSFPPKVPEGQRSARIGIYVHTNLRIKGVRRNPEMSKGKGKSIARSARLVFVDFLALQKTYPLISISATSFSASPTCPLLQSATINEV